MTTIQQQIESLLRITGNPQIEGMIEALRESTFYTARCHSHHHFVGGLAEHSLGVTQILLADDNLVKSYGHENVIMAGMFHDLCTANHPAWNNIGISHKGHKMHGRRSVRILGEYFHIHLHDAVYEAIKCHMHHPRTDANQRPFNPLHAALRRADHQNAATK